MLGYQVLCGLDSGIDRRRISEVDTSKGKFISLSLTFSTTLALSSVLYLLSTSGNSFLQLDTPSHTMPSSNGIPLKRFPSLSWCEKPTAPKGQYEPSRALEDLSGISYALHLFLASHMVEAEEFCHESDPKKYVVFLSFLTMFLGSQSSLNGIACRERLYFATGFGLIQCVKALMSFDDEVRLPNTSLNEFFLHCTSTKYHYFAFIGSPRSHLPCQARKHHRIRPSQTRCFPPNPSRRLPHRRLFILFFRCRLY